MKTAPTNKKVRELISMVKEGKLLPRPEFQRRLVWSREDKNHFLDSVLRGYPFPEIYLADGDVDLDTGAGTQLLVDGLQRVSTLIQYFDGDQDLKLTTVTPYRSLDEAEKMRYLQYDVAVRDLGAITKDQVIDVFRRLNATKYSLLDIEINNAVYAGALKKYCERLANDDFFRERNVFNALDYKRMGDLRYVLGIVGTFLQGYFNRDDAFEFLLDRFNDDFPDSAEIDARIRAAFDFIDECGFSPKSRVWKKADLFSLIVEMDQILNVFEVPLSVNETAERLNNFYARIGGEIQNNVVEAVYYKAALQASNDRINRVRRGIIIHGIVVGSGYDAIQNDLAKNNLL